MLLGKLRALVLRDDSKKAVAPSPAGDGLMPWVPAGPRPWVPGEATDQHSRLVFAVDATGSRSPTWNAAKKLTDSLFEALPGSLNVALAVHGGGEVHTFTHFTPDAGELRDLAAGIECKVGGTRLLQILKRVLKLGRVPIVVYIGDAFEEDEREAQRVAAELGRRQTRVIILHEGPPPTAFAVIAERSGGALLPFDRLALDRMGKLIEAAGILAAGDVEALETAAPTMPEARLLLEHLSDPKLTRQRK